VTNGYLNRTAACELATHVELAVVPFHLGAVHIEIEYNIIVTKYV